MPEKHQLHFETLEQRTLLVADLTAISVELDEMRDVWFVGEDIDAMVRVENIGSATAQNTHVQYYLGTATNRTLLQIGSGQLGGFFPFNDLSAGEVDNDWIGSPLPGGGWEIPPSVPLGTGYFIWAQATTDSVEAATENNWQSSPPFAIQNQLTWRDGPEADASVLGAISAGQTVYARYDGAPGEQIEIEVHEDDGAAESDTIQTFTITVGPDGFGTHAWAATWQGDDGDAPQNDYFLFHDGLFFANQSSANLSVDLQSTLGSNSYTTPLTYDWDNGPPGEGVIDVTLNRLDGSDSIDPLRQTWLVTHGRNGSFTALDDEVKQLADELVAARPQDQILTLEWSEGASSINGADFSQEAWIVSVANWAAETLEDLGFDTDTLNLVGHSFGAVISGELAAAFLGGVNTILAIDPAEDPPFVVSGSSYSTDQIVFGQENSNFSWAFYTPGIAGNEETPTTADEAFVVTDSEHTDLVELVASVLQDPTGSVSRFFDLDRLLNQAAGPWLLNQYDSQGDVDPAAGLYEGVIASTNNGTAVAGINFIEAGLVPIAGDYNSDNVVSGSDFLAWQRGVGTTGIHLPADGNFTGTVDQSDLAIWQTHYALPAPPSVATLVNLDSPELLVVDGVVLTPATASELPADDQPERVETPTDFFFSAWQRSYEARSPIPPEPFSVGNQTERLARSEGRTESPWLSDEILERVFG